MKKKVLLLSLSTIIACFCCACGNGDKAQKENDDNHISDTGITWTSCTTLYSSSGKIYYNNDKRVNNYHYDYQNISIPQDDIYYLCITDESGFYSYSTGKTFSPHYYNPAVFDDNGELISEPQIKYDNEYIQVVSKSNWLQCMYMIKPLKSVEKTTITIPEHFSSDDHLLYPEQSISITIE